MGRPNHATFGRALATGSDGAVSRHPTGCMIQRRCPAAIPSSSRSSIWAGWVSEAPRRRPRRRARRRDDKERRRQGRGSAHPCAADLAFLPPRPRAGRSKRRRWAAAANSLRPESPAARPPLARASNPRTASSVLADHVDDRHRCAMAQRRDQSGGRSPLPTGWTISVAARRGACAC